jgi:hypothetical protein
MIDAASCGRESRLGQGQSWTLLDSMVSHSLMVWEQKWTARPTADFQECSLVSTLFNRAFVGFPLAKTPVCDGAVKRE